MSTPLMFRASMEGGDHGIAPDVSDRHGNRPDPATVALWAFMAVATSLFSLFIAAYVMRMDGTDWSVIAMPWQLWLSTMMLIAGSVCLQLSNGFARHRRWDGAHLLLVSGGVFAIAFLGAQLWAWQTLLESRVAPAGNPAGSFFYLLTAMHGLHVAGGLAGWGATLSGFHRQIGAVRVARRMRLCARYWHFLLAVWLVLFGTLGWLTPEVVRLICGTR
ncbi:bb3-type cytochrome oxidase subunit III [Noviherbaspirillum sp. ST9]|uniref:bb3-type cytochrome oxidase subunit III n=1 Tax=Noviherbaspirillum sp. ST9 TaxID=3401606 RepID=UPI003B5869E3